MWVALLLLGCRPPEVEAFLDDRAAAICARHARCETLAAAGYADEETCLTTIAQADGALADAGTLGCDGFDAAAAEACLAAWDVDCAEVPDLSVCEKVCE